MGRADSKYVQSYPDGNFFFALMDKRNTVFSVKTLLSSLRNKAEGKLKPSRIKTRIASLSPIIFIDQRIA
jgi:hypothetical protein